MFHVDRGKNLKRTKPISREEKREKACWEAMPGSALELPKLEWLLSCISFSDTMHHTSKSPSYKYLAYPIWSWISTTFSWKNSAWYCIESTRPGPAFGICTCYSHCLECSLEPSRLPPFLSSNLDSNICILVRLGHSLWTVLSTLYHTSLSISAITHILLNDFIDYLLKWEVYQDVCSVHCISWVPRKGINIDIID